MSARAGSGPPVASIRAGVLLHRVHGAGRAARWYGRKDATARWDDPEGEFGVLYLGRSLEAAFAESLLRTPVDRDVLRSRIEQKRQAHFRTIAPLRLAKLHGEGLAWWEVASAQISDGAYGVPQSLSRKIHGILSVDGIQYRSRFDNDALCIALFDRADAKIEPVAEDKGIDTSWARQALAKCGYRLVDL